MYALVWWSCVVRQTRRERGGTDRSIRYEISFTAQSEAEASNSIRSWQINAARDISFRRTYPTCSPSHAVCVYTNTRASAITGREQPGVSNSLCPSWVIYQARYTADLSREFLLIRNGGRLSEHRFEHRNSYGLALDTVYIWRARSSSTLVLMEIIFLRSSIRSRRCPTSEFYARS